MKRNLRLAIALLLGAPGLSYALGLGDIHLSSALNQPLAADIDLLGATPEEVLQLRANLSSRETFTRYGLDRPAFLNSLTFKVVRDASGRGGTSSRKRRVFSAGSGSGSRLPRRYSTIVRRSSA